MTETDPWNNSEIEPVGFEMGGIYATPGAINALDEANTDPVALLSRHYQGDSGDMVEEDKIANNRAVELGGRIFSAYTLSTEERLWIITEADRSVTTLLLPMEY